MATSGSFTGSMGSYYTLYIYWEVKSQSVENNTSRVYLSWGVRKKAANNQTYNNQSASLKAQYGSTVPKDGYIAWDMRNASVGSEWSYYNTTVTIQHDADGNKSLYLYGYINVGSLAAAYSTSAFGYAELPQIPRATTPVLSSTSGDMGSTVTIDLTGAAVSTFTHDLSYELPNGTTGAIAQNIGAVTRSFAIPDFASSIPNATSGSVTVICTTKDADGNTVGSQSVALTATVPTSVVPSISSVGVTEAVSGIATQFAAFIQTKSRLSVAVTSEGARGSTISAVSSTFEGIIYNGASWTSSVVSGSGLLTIRTTVTDSRGRSASINTTVRVLPYQVPLIPKFTAYRVNASGAESASGSYVALRYAYEVSSLNSRNTAAMTIKAKPATEETYSLTLLSASALSEDTTALPATELSTDQRWDIQITVVDWFGASTSTAVQISTESVVFDVRSTGLGMGIGKVAENDEVDIDWDVRLRKRLFLSNGQVDVAQLLLSLINGEDTSSAELIQKPLLDAADADMAMVVTQTVDGALAVRRITPENAGFLDWQDGLSAAEERLAVLYGETITGNYILREFEPYKHVKGVLIGFRASMSLKNTMQYSIWKSGTASNQYALYEVEPGETYYITGDTPPSNTDYVVAAVYDADGQPLYLEPRGESAVFVDYPITMPANAATLAIMKYASATGDIAAKTRIDMTGIPTVDNIARSLIDVDEKVADIQETLAITNAIVKGKTLAPTETSAGLYDAFNNSVITTSSVYMHCVYSVEGLSRYYVNGQSADGNRYPCVIFLDASGTTIDTQGTTTATVFEDLLVQAPANAETMIVNRSYTSSVTISATEALIASGSVSEISSSTSYNLNMADALIREAKKNPFQFKPLDKGYVTFIFDDLKKQFDSIASIFEEHDMPMCIAAIPERLGWTCTELQEDRGSFTPGMLMTEVMDIVVENGGEILAHNTEFITEDNQYEYDFMYKYFRQTKETLESYGYAPRGIIRSGGTGAIRESTEFDRWLIGNYEYADFGTLPQFAWRRTTIQQSQNDLKAAILAAKTNKTWVAFMCHDYEFGEGETFTGEEDLEEILDYCESIGIDVVTCGYVFDHYASNALDAQTSKVATIALSTSWNGAGPYTQTVSVTGADVTANSKVDLQPDAATITQLISDGVSALFIGNNSGSLTAYAVGASPTSALTVQCTVTEVET